MKRILYAVAVLSLLTSSIGLARGAGQAPPQPARTTAAGPTQVSAILVDVVVRDRKGDPVRDLTQSDFEISEDGERQDIGSFSPIFLPEGPAAATAQPVLASTTPAAMAGPAGAPSAAPEAISKAPQIIALVFDRLSSDSRTLAYRAASKYLGQQATSANYMAVYAIDLQLMNLQSFTRDTSLIQKAIDKFAAHSSSQYGSSKEAVRQQEDSANAAMDAQDRMAQAAAAGGSGAGNSSAQIGSAAQVAAFNQMSASMTQTFEALERDQAGFASSNALLAVVNGMRSIPGRKSIVFFSEGLSIPPNVYEQFRSVVDAANRAGVSIYPMDAMGLRAESTVGQVRDEINQEGKLASRRTGRDQPGGAMMAGLERNEDLLRMDPNSGLGELADKTGGFLISNTNDLRTGFDRIESDMRNYYLLTYVPKNENFDGKFREISVRVKRGGVSVHARKGYYAVREAPGGLPVRTYEAPAMAALDRTPVPNAFPVRASVLRFPEKGHPQMISIVVELATTPITFVPSEDKKTYTSDFTVLVRFSDVNKQIVDKMSQRYQVGGPIEKLDQAKNGQVVFYRQPDLPPGFYTMETVVYDALSKKASVRFTTVEQPSQDTAQLRLSSLVLISRGEHAEGGDQTNPLIVHNTLLYPNLGVPFKKDADKELAFFFTAYPGANAQEPLSGTIELLQNANVLARSTLQLAAVDPDGRVQQLSRIPISALEPGDYQLRVMVTQGNKTVARATEFKIES